MINYKHILLSMAALASPAIMLGADSQDADASEHYPHVTVQADTRFDFDYTHTDDDTHSGFHGRYLNLIVHGEINKQLSVHLRQRLNKFGEMRNDVFGATDWVYIDYNPTEHWTLSGGKQVVAIGGYEYDRNPINIYFASMFWNNIACYQFGVSGAYHFDGGNHTLLAQVCNSPYQTIGNRCYAYNLMWMGNMGHYSTIWSTNLIEYSLNHYANIISLGNKLTYDNVYLEVDLMNRYSGHQRFLLDDYSLIGKLCATTGRFDVFAKGGYEHYRPVLGETFTVDKPFYGIGAEYYPIKGSRDLRLHVAADITHDSHTGQRITEVAAGLMWRITLLNK